MPSEKGAIKFFNACAHWSTLLFLHVYRSKMQLPYIPVHRHHTGMAHFQLIH